MSQGIPLNEYVTGQAAVQLNYCLITVQQISKEIVYIFESTYIVIKKVKLFPCTSRDFRCFSQYFKIFMYLFHHVCVSPEDVLHNRSWETLP